MNMTKTTQRRVEGFMRRAVAKELGHNRVSVIPGKAPPKLTGRGFYWTTPGGKFINHPNAYRWPKVYHASTLSIEVGERWLASRLVLPRGYRWVVDGYGVAVEQNRTKERWHPTHQQMFHGGKVVVMWARAAIEQRKVERRNNRFLRREAHLIKVTVFDSVRAGNCLHGTARFAKTHNADVSDPYAGIPADRLLKIADTDEVRRREIMRAVQAAYERATLVTI